MLRPLSACVALALTPMAQASDLLISGVIDATLTGGTPKAVELYVVNDIADLSQCGIGSANNGGGSDGQEFTFPDVAATSGTYLYVASESIQFQNFFGFAPDYTSSAANINGDDAIELYCGGTVVDVFGDINTDGSGEAWEYMDGWAYRESDTGPDGSTFDIENWSFSSPNALDGESSNATATTPFPLKSFGGASGGDTDNAPFIVSTSPADGDVDVASDATIDVIFSEPVSVTGWDALSCSLSGDVSVSAVSSDDTTFTLTPSIEFAAEEECSITVLASDVADLDGDAALSLTADFSFSFTTQAEDIDTGNLAGLGDLVIAGVVDGSLSGGLPKAIEVYVANDIDDLSQCGFGSANNGGGSDGQEFTFDSVNASAGSYIYIATEETQFTNFFGFAPDYTSNAAAINGDDAIELFCNDDVIDVFGDIDTDGTGEDWEYQDGWAARVAGSSADGSTFAIENWSFSGINALDNVDTNDAAETPYPLASYYVEEQLVIAGVFDGPLSGGTPKFVEFYAVSNIADLSIFGFGSANNGGGSDGQEYTFSGSAQAGDYLYIATDTEGFTEFMGFAPDDTTNAVAINGDDAIELFKDGEVADVFGDINTDGSGEDWEYLDGWAYRLSDTGPDGSTFVIDSWTFSGINAMDGESSNATAEIPFPTATFDTDGSGGGDGGSGSDVALGVCSDGATLISAVQGDGASTPLSNQDVVVEGVVSLAGPDLGTVGFFIQEEVADQDADPLTSEGLFVTYTLGELPAEGEVVRVLGTAGESSDRTQITALETFISCGTESIQPVALSLPFASEEAAEAYEGMLVSFDQTLTASNTFNLGRFGEVLVSNGRLYKSTQLFTPGSEEERALEAANLLNQIIIDNNSDGFFTAEEVYPDLSSGGLSATNTLRLGDTTSGVTGVMDYAFSAYRIRPTIEPLFTSVNPRPVTPELQRGDVTIASFNVLNYFTTLESRGADSEIEFERQVAKIVSAIATLDADVVGLMEIENNGFGEGSAIYDLITRLNTIMGEGTYSAVNNEGATGTDQIMVALLYKPAVVSPTEAAKVLSSENSITDESGVLFDDTKNRFSLAQQFTFLENDEQFVVNVNHLKSKGSGCGDGDDDTTTGQGNCNLTRTRAAQALTVWLDEEFGDLPTLIIGDLNAYALEDPIATFESNGYTNLARFFHGELTYGYTFAGETGTLDYALANEAALAKTFDAVEWNINADEPIVLDYNVENQTEALQAKYYAEDAFRASDHDPVVVTLNLEVAAEEKTGDVNGDGVIDFQDYIALAGALGTQEGDAGFIEAGDLDDDGVISFNDLRLWYQIFISQ